MYFHLTPLEFLSLSPFLRLVGKCFYLINGCSLSFRNFVIDKKIIIEGRNFLFQLIGHNYEMRLDIRRRRRQALTLSDIFQDISMTIQ